MANATPLSLDSLREVVNTPLLADSVYANAYELLAKNTAQANVALTYAQKGHEASVKTKDMGLIMRSYLTLGDVYTRQNNTQTALYYFDKVIKESKTHELKKYLGKALMFKGYIYSIQLQNTKAIESLLQSLDIAKSIHDTATIVNALSYIGYEYQKGQDFEKTLATIQEGLSLAKKAKNLVLIRSMYSSLALYYQSLGKTTLQKQYADSVWMIAKQQNDSLWMAHALLSLAGIEMNEKRFDSAQILLRKVLIINRAKGEPRFIAFILTSLAICSQALHDESQAELYGLEALHTVEGTAYWKELSEIYAFLAQLYTSQKRFDLALKYQTKQMEIKDSIFSYERKDIESEVLANLELQNAKKENNDLKGKEKENRRDLRIQAITIFVISALVVALSVILFLLYKSYLKNRIVHEQLTQKSNEIFQSNSKLAELNEIKDQLFSIISHDLRSPVQSLSSLLELLEKNALSYTQFQAIIPKLKKQTKETTDLLDNLLLWAKNQQKGIDMKPKMLNLKEIIEKNFALFTDLANQKNIQLTHNIPIDATAWADESMVLTVFRNLIHNALKFTNTGGQVNVSMKKEAAYVVLSVEDNGVGISPEALEKIFKGNFTTYGTKSEKGTGIGLGLAKAFIEQNGGKIMVESQEKKGTIFHVYILQSAE